MVIRPIAETDAAAFLGLARQLDEETAFMMLEPGERTATVEETADLIRRVRQAPNQEILVAKEDGNLVGYIGLHGGEFRRNRHCAYIVAGIRQAYAGRGLGWQLFTEGERWARAAGLHRVELTVMAHNQRALGLYAKTGFAIEGTKRHSLRVEGEYVDEYYMAKLLEA